MLKFRKLFPLVLLAVFLAISPANATSFTNVFGGSAVSPADVAFASYSFGSNLQLFWPQFSNGQPNVAARFMNLTATAPSLNVIMPDATLASVGFDAIIFNQGAQNFNVVTLNGDAIATIAPGQTYYLLLNDNTTQDGTWQTVQFGVGTGSADAAALAGSGLIASAGLLNVNLAGNIVSNSFTVTAAGNALLYVWTGGSGIVTLPTAASVGNGFFFALANNGTGSATVTASGGNTIDGASTSVFAQAQSGFVMSDGTNWVTVGKGSSSSFAITLLNLNVAGSSNVTETSAQAQNIIQQFTGALTGNINVIVPATVQLYFVENATSGAFTLTLKTASGTGIGIPQGTNAILYCDGTNVVNAFTASVSGTLALTSGSAVSPSLAFQGSLGTGLFSPTSNIFSATAGTTEVMRWQSVASAVNYWQISSSASNNALTATAAGTGTNVGFTFVPKGSGTVTLSKLDGTVIGGATPAAVTGTTITANTGFVGPLTGNVTGNASGTAANVTGTVAIANGGTGQTSATNAINALLPSQTGNSGKLLGTNGTASSWVSAGGAGTVTTTGSPATGNLTKFSGASSITNGDLSGDVTTSSTLTTTVAKITGTSVSGTTGSTNVVFSTAPTINQANLVGTTTNNNAAAGSVGEFKSSSIPVGSAVSLSSGAAADITSISLTAGDWDVWGNVITNPASGTTTGAMQSWIGTTSATIPTLPNGGAYIRDDFLGANANNFFAWYVGTLRLSLSTTTTVYLSTQINFGVSTMSAYGFLGARRVR